jgi:hypothetical protein
LVALGVTAIEIMPIVDFPGRWNWGYDGVLPDAPDSSYGRPEDLKALVEATHAVLGPLPTPHARGGGPALFRSGRAGLYRVRLSMKMQVVRIILKIAGKALLNGSLDREIARERERDRILDRAVSQLSADVELE